MNDFEIGRVVAVDTAQISVVLNPDLSGMSRNTYEGPQEVGQINSYVIIPIGAKRLVAMITRVVLVEESEIKADRTMVTLPATRRMIKATLIGTIEGESFKQGISLFPVLDSPVQLPSHADLDAVFGPIEIDKDKLPDPDAPGYCIPIGESSIMQGRQIRIDPDAFFGKHAAILGSTGSGKSCTIASLLQSIHEQPQVKRTTCIILDTNGEYRSAFQKQDDNGDWEDSDLCSCLYIPSDPINSKDRIRIPYWFMDSDDFVRLFQASKGVQRPVLLEALRLARNETKQSTPLFVLKDEIIREFNRILSQIDSDEKTSKSVKKLTLGLEARIKQNDLNDAWNGMSMQYEFTKEEVLDILSKIVFETDKHIDQNIYPSCFPADSRKIIRDFIMPIYNQLLLPLSTEANQTTSRSADSPSFFEKVKFRSQQIEQVLQRQESGGARARDYSGTMLLRIDRLLEDRRFDFLFGSVGEQLPNAEHVLATFLRDLLGVGSPTNDDNTSSEDKRENSLSDEQKVPSQQLPFYDRQRANAKKTDIVILDQSLLAAEVLENVTALIGRLILEFLQRLGEYKGVNARGSLPVMLVLEEAQNYIHQPRFAEEESISRIVFERIAREGRKFGLSLVVASQRPSELSKTVLSQCNSFIVHRLQNPEDLRYFKEIVPGIYGPLLDQLPALAPQTALVLGECVSAPALVKIRNAQPLPRSRDPKFYRYWVDENAPNIDFESICAIWEGNIETSQ